MDFRLLGPLEVHDGGDSLRLGPPKQRALLTLLLLRANEVISRDSAIDGVWGDEPPERAAQALQVYVHGLRKLLGHERILLRGTGYSLRVESGELDLQRFERALAAGQTALSNGDAPAAAEHFRVALELWRGDPLVDVDLARSAEPERARLDELRLRAVELDLEARLALEQHEDLVPRLEALVADQPLREGLRRQLMLALYRSGRQSEALEVFRQTKKLLADELGLDPSPGLSELERAILRHDPSLQPPKRRAKLRLPAPATPLVGRDLDVAAVCAQLREETRLLTLTGPGGIGKTRLAIEAAAVLGAELDDGATFVDLAPTADPANVAATIAAAVGVPEADTRPATEALVARLRPLEAVLVLDNFERLLDAAPLVADLLEQAPSLRVLVTSRAPLHLTTEHEYEVHPLEVAADAVELFVGRALAADPAFRLTDANAAAVSAICASVEGLPLALELAAARIKVLTPDQLLERLARPLTVLTGGGRDLPVRQQTLRSTLDWSYALLDERAQRVFRELSVFAGGCTLEAAETVVGADLDSVSSLLDNSLLRRLQPRAASPRFRMLDTVREYAAEQLEDDGPQLRLRHARYFTALAERLGPDLVGPRRVAAVHELVREHENLRAALATALEQEVELGFRIAAAARPYWSNTNRGAEIRTWLERAFAGSGALDTRPRVGAMLVLGRELMNDGAYAESRAAVLRTLDAARDLECWSEAAVSLGYLAWLSAAEGDDDGCRRFAEEAVDLGRRAGDLWAERQGLAMVASTLLNTDDYAGAADYLDRSLLLARELDDPSTLVLALVNRSYAAIAGGELARARTQLEEALELSRQLDEPASTVSVLFLLAWEASLAGEPERARGFLLRALDLQRNGARHRQLIDVLSEAALELEPSDPRTAARILGAADTSYADHGTRRAAPLRRRYEPLHGRLASALGSEEFARAVADGARLTPEEAAVQALDALAAVD